jgi:glyoxylase-like metal-dependent hydrolase (beta-lactamase superfamily II)
MPKIDILMEGSSVGTDQGIIGFCAVILVEGEKRVLFDSAHVGRRTYLQAQLQARGLAPRDIDLQVLSHAHWDHVQNVDLFDHAPLLVHRDERRYAGRPHPNDWATPKWTGAVIEMLNIQEVGEGYEIMPGCRVIDLPGHSPGSIGLQVETEDGSCLVVGDAIHNGVVALRGRNPLVFWNAEQADASIRRCVQSGALIYPGHDRPFRIRDGELSYGTAFSMTLSGVGPNVPGVSFIENPPPREQWVMPGIEEQRLD